LLADAKYLHQKLSALKNVGAPSGMLETIVAEMGVGRTGQPVALNNAGHRTMTLPAPISDLHSSGPAPPPAINGMGTGRQGDINGGVGARLSSLMSAPPAPVTPPPPREELSGNGFKQVQLPLSSPLASPPPASVPPARTSIEDVMPDVERMGGSQRPEDNEAEDPPPPPPLPDS
jgi:vacuolar protein sorting-associated protein 54